MSKEDRNDTVRARGTTPVGYIDEKTGRTRPLEGGSRGPFVHSVADPEVRRAFRFARTNALAPADVSDVAIESGLLVNEPYYTDPIDVEPYSTMVLYARITPETVNDYLIWIVQVANVQLEHLEARGGEAARYFHSYPLAVDDPTQRPLLGEGGLGLTDKDLYVTRTFHPAAYRTPRIADGLVGTDVVETRLAIPYDVTPFKSLRLAFAVENDDGAGTFARGDGTVSLSYALGTG